MNAGTKNSQAFGFDLNLLSKVSVITTHYIVVLYFKF